MKRLLVLLTVFAVTGCSGLYDVPLPGGADLGPHPYTVTAEFADVMDLVPQASVRVNDVPVGRVDAIGLAETSNTAEVTITLNGNTRLPANTAAALQQSSLLGEKYVQLIAPPADQAQGTLTGGSVIGLDRTSRGPEVEEVLGALSLLLNGGGIGQVQSIVRELNSAMSGNEPQLREFLSTVDQTVRGLDGQRANITAAIDGLNRLSGTVSRQRGDIANALENLAPGLRVINEQRDQLLTMLRSLDSLSGVAVDTVTRSRDELVADLRSLTPTLRQLAAAGRDLPESLQDLITFPFTDYAVNDVQGDYFNADVNVDLDLSGLLQTVSSLQATAPVSTPALPLPAANPPQNDDGVSGLLHDLLGGGP
ncbi:MCE family protein [Amycolatopsis acidicola]|uniref:MCE family protein n=1 Tax=Amycolatopsis acidicola TaxID=2596893 RepID=A0A5N0UP66_9PSEU|nr:MCE family protein [Amycolatopsis acidicola]KAA9152316.1 MCE family protein [Amycolatopsis acidicola]